MHFVIMQDCLATRDLALCNSVSHTVFINTFEEDVYVLQDR